MMSTKTADIFREIAAQIPGARLSNMFGCPCIKAPNGKAAAMFWKDNLIVKPPKESLERMLSDGFPLFTPIEGGRPMGGWVVIPAALSKKWLDFAQESYEYVKHLEKNEKQKKA